MPATELSVAQLYRPCDTTTFDFKTTEDVDTLEDVVGQARAVEAVEFGVGMNHRGYNMFALGAPGTGKQSLVTHSLQKHAAARPPSSDFCYVSNFDDPHRPRALSLPAGRGTELRRDIEALVEELRTTLASAFESEEYQARRQAIEDEFKGNPEREFTEIERRAKEDGLRLLRTPMGLAFAPVRDDEVISGEDFRALPEEVQKNIQEKVEAFQEEAQKILRQIPKWDRERHEKVRGLNREVTDVAAGHLIDEIRKKFEDLPAVCEFLDALRKEIREHPKDFFQEESSAPTTIIGEVSLGPRSSPLRRYLVNVLVDAGGATGAPVIYEDNPTYDNLIGRIEHISQLGALVTDHNLIKAGALHRANGGYLLLDAHKLLRSIWAWEALKRALQSKRLRIESLGQALSLVSTVSLEPEPAELDVQVVLLGEPMVYYLLSYYDPDFNELFKVAIDFDERMDADQTNQPRYVQLIASLTRREGLRPFDQTGVARVLEHSTRVAGDQRKFSARINVVVDLLRESNYWAGQLGHDIVGAEAVQRAIDAQLRRSDRYRERLFEEIFRGTLKIDTEGTKIGQVNGLSVVSLGTSSFGHPTRITARARLGEGDVVDIEREVELGGPIHSKGVLILSSYLGARYAPDRPLSLSASLGFEQTYGGVEGDSASAAELFALLSAVSRVPLRQDLAVTGSINQHGEVQAIGGINEKIEGFFDICAARGFTKNQGVIVPTSNVEHLMLKKDVVDAVANGLFHIYAIDHVDEGLELLTGMPTPDRDGHGDFSEGSFNHIVEKRLLELAEERKAFKTSTDEGGD